MKDPDLHDQIAAGWAYEKFHVPALFQQWSAHVLDAARIEPGHRVLDVACGTGVLAREAEARVGPTGFVAGIDPDHGMLMVARQLAPMVEWQQGTAEFLPYSDRAFDAVMSQFGLMFFTDRHQALREMCRVLVPEGILAVAVWDRLENSPVYSIEVELLNQFAGKQAADALRAPFVLGDTQELTTLFEDAGITTLSLATKHGTARFPSIRAMVEADLRGWLPIMGVVLMEEQIQNILAEAEIALREYVAAEGQVVFDSPAHIITGKGGTA